MIQPHSTSRWAGYGRTVAMLSLLVASVHAPAMAGTTCQPSEGAATGSAPGLGAFACGSSTATAFASQAFGFLNTASADNASAFGIRNTASGVESSAFGHGNTASGARSSAFGFESRALNTGSTAIGYQAIADRDYSVAVGSGGNEHQIIHLADGTEATDAVNLRQMRAADDELGAGIAAWLGGGAAYAGGVFTAPVYVIQSSNYNNVGAAFGAVDAALTDINQRIVDAGGIQGERGDSAYEVAVRNGFAGTEADWLGSLQGPVGPGGPQGPEGPAGGGPRSVVYDNDGRDVLTLAGENGTTIANVADGVAATDAVNVRQMQAGDAATLASASTYTDTVAVQTLQSANEYTDSRFAAWDAQLDSIQRGIDDRFHQQDRRIDRQGAMGSAMLNMAINAAGSQSARGRIAVGAGFQGSEQALSIGYGRKLGTRGSFSLGGAFSGSEKSAGIGFGMDL
ncbi:YadA-like family protein [Luteimonas aestuarii]|nr:YadA-like family protein [Luteimonas aestuarii]